jgi:hypothetical protein
MIKNHEIRYILHQRINLAILSDSGKEYHFYIHGGYVNVYLGSRRDVVEIHRARQLSDECIESPSIMKPKTEKLDPGHYVQLQWHCNL